MKYVCKYIVKPFKVKILRYEERLREMHNLANYLYLPSTKDKSAMASN